MVLVGLACKNAILIVEFANQLRAHGMTARDAVQRAATLRLRPILMTTLAAMMGAFFILDDPIFNGLAISLIFGIFVSTALTLLVLPAITALAGRWSSPQRSNCVRNCAGPPNVLRAPTGMSSVALAADADSNRVGRCSAPLRTGLASFLASGSPLLLIHSVQIGRAHV